MRKKMEILEDSSELKYETSQRMLFLEVLLDIRDLLNENR